MIKFKVRDRDSLEYLKIKRNSPTNYGVDDIPARIVWREGTEFEVGGTRVELFPISVMAEAIDRSSKWIQTEERAGKWPKPIFAVKGGFRGAGKQGVRVYSSFQIINVHRLMWNVFNKKNWQADRESMLKLIREVWPYNKFVVNEKGEYNPDGVER